MKKEDTCKLPPSAQEEKRKLAIKLRNKNYLIKDIAETLGVSPQAVSGWIKRYKEEGLSSLKARKRGPETGATRQLTEDQEKRLRKMIVDKTPDQIKLAYAL